jgi:hypothetical protein
MFGIKHLKYQLLHMKKKWFTNRNNFTLSETSTFCKVLYKFKTCCLSNHVTSFTEYSQLLKRNPLFFLYIWHLSKSNDIITSPLLITFCFTIFFFFFIYLYAYIYHRCIYVCICIVIYYCVMILLGTIILYNIQVTKYRVTIIIFFSVHALYDRQVRSTILLCDIY